MKKFSGLTLSPLEIRANLFDGFGLSLFTVTIVTRYKVTHSTSNSLFSFNFVKRYDYGGEELCLFVSLFFFSIGKIVLKTIKEPSKYCENCSRECETKEYYVGKRAYCCQMCQNDGEY